MVQAPATSTFSYNRPSSNDGNLLEADWHADVSEPEGFSGSLRKRTGGPKRLKIMGMVLKTTKRFIHLQDSDKLGHKTLLTSMA
jgi:hypothetical protein